MRHRNFINLTDVEKLINIAIEGKAIEIDDGYFIILDVEPKMKGLSLSLSVYIIFLPGFSGTQMASYGDGHGSHGYPGGHGAHLIPMSPHLHTLPSSQVMYCVR